MNKDYIRQSQVLLKLIDTLKEKGVITEEEYKKILPPDKSMAVNS